MKKTAKILRWLGVILLTPLALFLVAAILLYIPPVQNFVVHRVASSLSRSMGMDISIQEVRLAFPLDLAVHEVRAVEKGDTLLEARSLYLSVPLRPLFSGQADIDGFALSQLKLNTKSYISDTYIKGTAEELTAAAHGVNWQQELVRLDRVKLRGADVFVALSDTAQKDTTESIAKWRIEVAQAEIERSAVRLTMPGDSMRIAARIGKAVLQKGNFDTGRGIYAARYFELRDGAVAYDLPYEKPVKGLDYNHLAIDQLGLIVDTLCYGPGNQLKVGIRRASLREKCGLQVNGLRAQVGMDNTQLRLPAFHLRTPYSQIDLETAFDFRSFAAQPAGRTVARMKATLGREDVKALAAAYLDPAYLKALPAQPLTLDAQVSGNMNHMVIDRCELQVPGVAQLTLEGSGEQLMTATRRGEAQLHLRTQDLRPLHALLPADLKETVNLPSHLTLRGKVGMRGDRYSADLRLAQGGGSLAARGEVNLKNEGYRVQAQAKQFPLANFLKGQPLGPFTGELKARGAGFDVMGTRALLKADAQVQALNYERYDLSGLKLEAQLRQGKAQVQLVAANPLLDATADVAAYMGKKDIAVDLNANIRRIDLYGLGVTADTLDLGTDVELHALTNRQFTAYSVVADVKHNRFITPQMSAMAKDLHLDFATSRDTTTAYATAGDLRLRLGAKGAVPLLSGQIGTFLSEISHQVGERAIDQEKLKTLMPVLSVYLEAGHDNPLYNLARMKQYGFTSVYFNLNTDPQRGLTGLTRVGKLKVGGLLLDTIDSRIIHDSTGVQLFGLVKNGKKNPTPLEVRLKSYFLKAGAGIELIYLDSKGKKGVDLGLQAELTENGAYLHFYPQHPILAYRNFTVNKGNYLFIGKNKKIQADMDLLADDGTGLKIYGEPRDSLNDLTVSVNQLNLDELSSVLPYMPRLGGMLSGDFHITTDTTFQNISAVASIDTEVFKFEGTPLGNVGIEALYLPKKGGGHHASAFISSNGEEVLACNGTYYDRDGGSFKGDAQLQRFPLRLLNGFMVGTDVALKGRASGDIEIEGSLDKPLLNGSLDLDSAHIYSDVYGFDFRTDERAVEIKDSRILFDRYNLYSTGKEPLVLNGVFDMSNFDRMKMDFTMRAQNFELINTRKKAQSMVFGKVYANFLGSLKGTTDNLSVRGKLEVLDRTDMTYILKDSPLSVDNRLNDLVEFVNFKDTTKVKQTRPVPEGSFDLTLGISVSDAARFHCDLSEDGQSYVDLEGGGDLTLRMTQQGEMRMTGRFTTNSGEMKYALPVIPLKTFHLVQGSYVEFTGDVMNPTLNIAAKERTKAVVTENDKPRSVAFDVGVAITKPLNEMGLEFTIEAPEDLAIQNQLASMSAEQRGKAAVTMMATGMYMTDETMMSGSGFKANNALNAFLQSEIQNIAGSALKTIDINLGVESGTTATGTSTTDYSFQFAKRFWGNRISVIIGGKVSTGADAQNSAESFINNVSVEYRLDKSATRYVKVFYDRDSQDPLEGQLTKTGAGLVLRRKTDRLGELFIFRTKKKKVTETEMPVVR